MHTNRLILLLGLIIGSGSPAQSLAQPPVAVASEAPYGEPPSPEAAAAPSSQPRGLALADFEQMALSNNPVLAQGHALVQAANGQWVQAGLYPNPSLGYIAEEIGDQGTAGQQGAYFGQQFVTAGKLRLNRAVASQDIARAEQQLVAQQFRVLTDVRISYYRALISQQRSALAEQLVGVAQNGMTAADALLKAQEASRIELIQTRIQLNSARALAINAGNDFQAAWKTLVTVAGCPEMPPQSLDGSPQPGVLLTWDETLQRVVAESPELAVAWSELERARWAAQRACAGRYPDLVTQASVRHDSAGDQMLIGIQAGVALPIFNRNQGAIARAQAEVAAAERNVDRVQLGLQNRLAEAFRQYSNARNLVEQYRDAILPDAQAGLDLVEQGYRQGEMSYLELLNAQRTYFQSNLAYLDALVQLKTAEAVIEGRLLSDSLQSGVGGLSVGDSWNGDGSD